MHALQIMGFLGPILAMVALFGVVGAVVLAVFVGIGWRPPAFLWWIAILSEMAIGAIGFGYQAKQGIAALAYVDPSMAPALGAMAYSEASMVLAVALFLSAALAILSAVLLSLAAALSAGETTQWTVVGALPGPLLLLLTLGVAVVVWLFIGEGRGLFIVGSLLAALGGGAIALLPAGLRVGEEPADVLRTAAARASVSALTWAGVVFAGVAGVLLADGKLFASVAASAEPLQKVVFVAAPMVEVVFSKRLLVVGVLGTTLACAASGLRMAPQLGNARAFLGAAGTFLMVGAMLAATGGAWWVGNELRELPLQRGAVAVLAGFQGLPEPGDGGEPLQSTCFVASSTTGWSMYPAATDLSACPAGSATLPLVTEVALALKADRPAATIAQERWSTGEKRLRVVTRAIPLNEELGQWHPLLKVLPFGEETLLWKPQGSPPEQIMLLERVDGAVLVAPSGTYPLASLDEVRTVGTDGDWAAAVRIVMVPGEQWTIQQVISTCAQVRARAGFGTECGLQHEPALLQVAAPEPDVEVSSSKRSRTDAMSQPAVREGIEASKGHFQYCYERQLKRNPELRGRVTLDWSIDDGRVTRALVSSNSTKNADLGDCLVDQMKRLKFGSGVTTDVGYSFVFSPG